MSVPVGAVEDLTPGEGRAYVVDGKQVAVQSTPTLLTHGHVEEGPTTELVIWHTPSTSTHSSPESGIAGTRNGGWTLVNSHEVQLKQAGQ